MFDPCLDLPIEGGLDLAHVLVQDGRDYSKPPAVAGLVEDWRKVSNGGIFDPSGNLLPVGSPYLTSLAFLLPVGSLDSTSLVFLNCLSGCKTGTC